MTKATDREAGGPRRSLNWAAARRGMFKVFADRVEVGDWRIPFASVDRAALHRVPYLFVFKLDVLELEADGRTYQFGFNPWADPVPHLPLEIERRAGKLGYSKFSVVVRLLAAAAVLYFLWDAFA